MIHEIFLALLGFTGDIIVETEVSFAVKDGLDVFTISERQQMNTHQPKWTNKLLSPGFQAYLSAMCIGIEDFLHEYTHDVSFLEDRAVLGEQLTLSQLISHMNKYIIVMPRLYNICTDITKRDIRGCQLLDFLVDFQCGIPILSDIVQRMLLRVRVVFIRQCISWMLYGLLEDAGEEFFIRTRLTITDDSENALSSVDWRFSKIYSDAVLLLSASSSTSPTALPKLNHALTTDPLSIDAHVGSFDWNNSYMLRLGFVPDSHVSSKLASKIIFCGKAVKLLEQSFLSSSSSATTSHFSLGAVRGIGQSGSNNSAFGYLSRGHYDLGLQPTNEATVSDEAPSPSDDPLLQHLSLHFSSCGLDSTADIASLSTSFEAILTRPEEAIERFQALVERVHSSISGKLWASLKTRWGFPAFLQVVRGTYLMGKGELYQALLDNILALTTKPVGATRVMNNQLQYEVMRSSAKVLGLDDEELVRVVRLTVNSSACSLSPQDFALESVATAGVSVSRAKGHHAGGEFVLVGSAVLETKVGLNEYKEAISTASTAVVVVRLSSVEKRNASELTKAFWSSVIAKSADVSSPFGLPMKSKNISHLDQSDNVAGASIRYPRLGHPNHIVEYNYGCLWLSDRKFVSKGFYTTLQMSCDWTTVRSVLTARHPIFNNGHIGAIVNTAIGGTGSGFDSRVLRLGSFQFVLHNNRDMLASPKVAPQATSSAWYVPGSVVLELSFYARINDASDIVGKERPSLCYFARLSVLTTSASSLPLARTADAGSSSSSGDVRELGYSLIRLDDDDYYDHLISDARLRKADMDESVSEVSTAASSVHGEKPSRFGSSIRSDGLITIEIEYLRKASSGPSVPPSASSSVSASLQSLAGGGGVFSSSLGGLSSLRAQSQAAHHAYFLRARVKDSGRTNRRAPTTASLGLGIRGRGIPLVASDWDVEVPLELGEHVKVQAVGGYCYAGVVGSGLIFRREAIVSPSSSSSTTTTTTADDYVAVRGDNSDGTFACSLYSLDLKCSGALNTYPAASPFTTVRYPETSSRLSAEVEQIRAWMGLKLVLNIPPIFRVLFDSDAISAYDRVFSALIKVRLVAHMLERLWVAKSKAGSVFMSSNRVFNLLRHSMHFFATNLLFYIQVDVIDSEFADLQRKLQAANEFQDVLKAHRGFLAAVNRLSLVDNVSVQESIERVLQVCLRFISICRLLYQQEAAIFSTPSESEETHSASHTSTLSEVIIPLEEMESVCKDFFMQISYLFQIMRKVENRGFMFRLDFNGYLSNLSSDMMGTTILFK